MNRKHILTLSVALFAVGCQSDDHDSLDKPDQPPATNPGHPMKNQPLPASDGAFVGMDVDAAAKHAEKSGLRHRVVERDGKPLPATRDYRPDRVNFSVKAGKVVKVTRG